jgi:hypothetical protein
MIPTLAVLIVGCCLVWALASAFSGSRLGYGGYYPPIFVGPSWNHGGYYHGGGSSGGSFGSSGGSFGSSGRSPAGSFHGGGGHGGK